MIGLTYRRGQVDGETVEANDRETRSAGQFADYLSAEILSADSGAIGFHVGPLLSREQGALLFYFTPTLASDAGSLGGFGRLFHIGPLSSGLIGFYDKGNTRFSMERAGGGPARVTATFAAGQPCAVLVGWDASKNYVAFNGGTIEEAANSTLPATFDGICHVGTDDLGFNYLEIKVGQVIALASMPTQRQWEHLAALRSARPAAWGEGGTRPSALWYGEDTRVLVATDASTEVDLEDAAGEEVRLLNLEGTGIGRQRHTAPAPPLRDGAIYVSTFGDRRRLVADLLLTSRTTFEHLQSLRRELVRVLNPRRGQGVLTYAPTGSTRLYEVDAIVDENGAPLDERLGPGAYQPRIPFVCDDPDWRDVVRAREAENISGAGWAFPWVFPWEWTPSRADVDVENEGDQDTWPVLRLTAAEGGLSDPAFENRTTGKALRFSGLSLEAGEVLVVDMDARTAVVEDGDAETNVMGFRRASSEMWALAPGTNTVRASVGSGRGSAEVFHAPRFAGV